VPLSTTIRVPFWSARMVTRASPGLVMGSELMEMDAGLISKADIPFSIKEKKAAPARNFLHFMMSEEYRGRGGGGKVGMPEKMRRKCAEKKGCIENLRPV